MPEYSCLHCSEAFEPYFVKGQNVKKYCTKKCSKSAGQKRRYQPRETIVEDRVCLGCGVSFTPTNTLNIYCDNLCKGRKKSRERHKKNYVPRPKKVRLCDIEGCEKKHLAQGRCAIHYKRWQIEQGNIHYGFGSGKNEKKRAEYFGVAYEPINRTELYTRDEFTCQICQEPLDMEAVFPAPLSPSLDHIIPISKGGPHTMDNAQSAHLSCNMKKRDKVGDSECLMK